MTTHGAPAHPHTPQGVLWPAPGHEERPPGPRLATKQDASTGGLPDQRNGGPRQGPESGAPEAAATSLVLSSESVPEDHDDGPIVIEGVGRICPKRPQLLVCDQDPSIRRPVSCDAYRCPVCGPGKAVQAAAVATWALRQVKRARFMTLTLAPETHQQRRKKIRVAAQDLRAAGYRNEWAWAVEQGTKTGMTHVHLLQHGSYIPQRMLEAVWGARVDVRAVGQGSVARYVTKDALRVAGYVVKGGTASLPSSGLDDYLDLNGGRAMHWSRGFLHGKTKREALGLLTADLSPSDGIPRTWHLEPVITV